MNGGKIHGWCVPFPQWNVDESMNEWRDEENRAGVGYLSLVGKVFKVVCCRRRRKGPSFSSIFRKVQSLKRLKS